MDRMRRWMIHAAIFAVGQIVLLVLGQSWLGGVLFGNIDPVASSPLTDGGEAEALPLLTNIGRLWCIVFVVDTIWSLFSAVSSPKEERQR